MSVYSILYYDSTGLIQMNNTENTEEMNKLVELIENEYKKTVIQINTTFNSVSIINNQGLTILSFGGFNEIRETEGVISFLFNGSQIGFIEKKHAEFEGYMLKYFNFVEE